MVGIKKMCHSICDFLGTQKKNICADVFRFFGQKDFFKKFIFTYIAYFFGLLSIIQANFLYKTDVQRVTEGGQANWSHSGRYLNDFFVYLFHFDSYPRDISPLSQLISIFSLTLASMVLVYVVCKKTSYLALFFSIVLGLSPYFLQIISYNFDCLFYCFSVCYVIFPFLFYKNDKTFYLTSCLGILLAYLSWQASISIYMIVVTYLFWADFCNKEIPLKKLIKKMILTVEFFLLVSVFYSIMVRLISVDGSVVSMQGDFCKLSECADLFAKNFNYAVLSYFIRDWKSTPIGNALLMVVVMFSAYTIKTAIQNTRSTNKIVEFINIVIALLCPLLMLLFIILWTMFFTFIYWNARIWVGFGACFTVMMLAMTNERNRYFRKIMMLFCILLTWGCVVFATRVGNLMDVQKRYEDFIFTTLSQDLAQFPKIKNITFVGRDIQSPVVRMQGQKYNILHDLVTAVQLKYTRAYAYYLGLYRPDLKRCKNKKAKYKKVLLDNVHHKFTQINDSCVEINIK